jgi:hypothetical protein
VAAFEPPDDSWPVTVTVGCCVVTAIVTVLVADCNEYARSLRVTVRVSLPDAWSKPLAGV